MIPPKILRLPQVINNDRSLISVLLFSFSQLILDMAFKYVLKKIERFLSDFTWRFFSLEALSHVKWIRSGEKDKNRSKSQLKAHELSAWVCSRKIADQRNKDTGLFRFMLLFVVTQNNNTQIEVLITEVLIMRLKGAYWARAFHKLLEIS